MALVGLEGQPPDWKPSVDWIVVLVHRFGYFLGHLRPTGASGKAIWLCFGLVKFL